MSGAYRGVQAFNEPHGEEQPIIDAMETRADYDYFEPPYDPYDDDGSDVDADFEPEYDAEGNEV